MKNRLIILIFACVAVFIATSCKKNLDLFPQNDLTQDKAYSTPEGYKSVLAKAYGGLSVTGNTGPAGTPDIQGLDEGSQIAFIRMFYNCQELPTDEAIVAWNDQTIHDFHNLKWTSSDPFLKGMYARPIYNITLINEYLRESTDDKVAGRGITGTAATEIKQSRAEVRFLRAFNYWVMMDLFGKSTFITEADGIGTFLPREIQRDSLFLYIESELKAIDGDLATPKSTEYGHVDKATDWSLLARMYLNAQVYTGTTRYNDAATYAKKVIDAGYALQTGQNAYFKLFMADNDKSKNEIIWAINCDGMKGQAYGNTTFLIHAPAGDDAADYGVTGGWNGYRATSTFGDKFPKDGSGNIDSVADLRGKAFYTSKFSGTPTQGKILTEADVSNFATGYHIKKYVNKRSDGGSVTDPTKTYSDIDFPVFRLSEMYLIYAEAVLRGATTGDAGNALTYVNIIRTRAGAAPFGSPNLTLQNLLDERARELFWEGHRRTDLIRYGMLTTSTYLWPWKGGIASGTAVDSKYNIFPVPAANISANPNLTQNIGY
ncbi:MAG: RagB/SusD family nutrient uptake outer membrane protein [Bacteroidota bacterium]